MENETSLKKNLLNFNKIWGTQLSLVAALIILITVFSIASEYFFTFKNFINIAHYIPILGIMAAGCTVALIVGALDISQYSILALVGVSCIMLNRAGVSIGVIILFALLAGIFLGAINGFIVTVLKINPIIGTIASGMVLRGFTYMLTASRTLSISPDTREQYYAIGRGTFLGMPLTFIVMAGVYLIIFIILKHTKLGRYIFAVGGNSNSAFLAGINLKKIRFAAFMISGCTAGIGGFLLLAQIGSFQPNTGEAGLLDAVGAVLLGGISLKGGSGKLTGTILGVIIFIIIQNGMTILGVQSFWQMIVRGLIIILAVYVNVLRGGGFK